MIVSWPGGVLWFGGLRLLTFSGVSVETQSSAATWCGVLNPAWPFPSPSPHIDTWTFTSQQASPIDLLHPRFSYSTREYRLDLAGIGSVLLTGNVCRVERTAWEWIIAIKATSAPVWREHARPAPVGRNRPAVWGEAAPKRRFRRREG